MTDAGIASAERNGQAGSDHRPHMDNYIDSKLRSCSFLDHGSRALKIATPTIYIYMVAFFILQMHFAILISARLVNR